MPDDDRELEQLLGIDGPMERSLVLESCSLVVTWGGKLGPWEAELRTTTHRNNEAVLGQCIKRATGKNVEEAINRLREKMKEPDRD